MEALNLENFREILDLDIFLLSNLEDFMRGLDFEIFQLKLNFEIFLVEFELSHN